MLNIDIAVIGIGLRFPNDTNSLEQLWDLLVGGSIAISKVPHNRWPTDIYQDANKKIPGRSSTFNAGILSNIRDFDASFFGISPKEAEWLDPQQRILLEVTYECIEDAGIKMSDFKGSNCGVFTGISSLDYGLQAPKDLASITAYTMTGNTLSLASNRISYVYDLHGPSISMDTACSSSLVTLHEACQSLRLGEIPCALVAGAHLLQDPYSFIGFSKASMLSPTGTCHPFADDANGYVRSEGVAVLLLKPLVDAIRDNNKIHAVIKSSGVNTDGSRKNGLTIPSQIAQEELMKKVLAESGLKVTDIDYVEAHGTGTSVGDPIEANSISSVYGIAQKDSKVLPISSVKANLGHMEPVSGLASFIKAVLCLKNGYIPPIPFDFKPNKNIDFDKLNLQCVPNGYILGDDALYTAAINSFGFGGANAHVIIQNYREDSIKENNELSVDYENPLFISAKSKTSLQKLCMSHAKLLEENKNVDLLAYSYKALTHRDWYKNRLVIRCDDKNNLVKDLKLFAVGETPSSVTYAENTIDYKKIAFVFNGNGSQYVGMGQALYQESKVFANWIDKLSSLIEKYINVSISDLLSNKVNDNSKLEVLIQDTKIAQPLIFAIQVSLCKLLAEFGIKPKAVVGHSMGEIAASFISGHLSLEQAIKVICVRSILQDRTKGQGRMAALSISKDSFVKICSDHNLTNITVAAVNSRDNITVSGDKSSLELVKSYCKVNKIFFKYLDVDYPFHSSYMDIIKDDVLSDLQEISSLDMSNYEQNVVDFYSAVKGKKLEQSEILDNNYWWNNIREQVNFYGAVKNLLLDGYDYIIEIGSSAILQRYIRDIAKEVGVNNSIKISSTLLENNDHLERIKEVVFDCYLSCNYLDKEVLYSNLPNKVILNNINLPHYAWDHKLYEYQSSVEKSAEKYRKYQLLGWKIPSADFTWENILEPAKNQLLRDHCVDGQYVFAAADYIETILEASQEFFKQNNLWLKLEYLHILSPLTFDGDDNYKSIRVRIVSSDYKFEFQSKNYLSNDDWITNIIGRLCPSSDENAYDHKFDEYLKSLNWDKNLNSNEIYEITQSIGLGYGNNFRKINSVYVNTHEKLIKTDLVTDNEVLNIGSLSDSCSNYIIHPGIIDAAFQSLLAVLCTENFKDRLNSLYLPIKFGNISIRTNDVPKYILGKVKLITKRSILADFNIYDSANKSIGCLENCRFNLLPKSEHNNSSTIACWHYEDKPIHHDDIGVVASDFTSNKIIELLSSSVSLNSINRSEWFENIIPLQENAILYYVLDAFRKLSTKLSFSDLIVNREENHPLVNYSLNLLLDHKLVSIDENNNLHFYSDNDETSSDEIIRCAYSACPKAINDLLNVYRLGNRLDELLYLLISKNEEKAISIYQDLGLSFSNKSLSRQGVYQSLSELIVKLSSDAKKNNQVIRILELGENQYVEDIVDENNSIDEKNIDLISLDHNKFDRLSLNINEDGQKIIYQNNGKLNHNKFDLIVISEELHNANISNQSFEAIENIKNILSDNGILVAIERFDDWSENLFNGVYRNWWNVNNRSSLRVPLYWKSILNEVFSDVATFIEPLANDINSGLYLVIARNTEKEIVSQNNQCNQYNQNSNNIIQDNICSNSLNNLKQCNSNNHKCLAIVPSLNRVINKEDSDYEENNFIASFSKKFIAINNSYDVNFIDYQILASIQELEDFNIGNNDSNNNSRKDNAGSDVNCNDGDLNKSLNKSSSLTKEYHDIVDNIANYSQIIFISTRENNADVCNIFQSITNLINKISYNNNNSKLSLTVVTFNADISPKQSALLGLSRVISNEFHNIDVKSIDLDSKQSTCDDLCRELLNSDGLDEVVLRNNSRYCKEIGFGFTKKNVENLDHNPSTYELSFTNPGRLKNLCWFEKNNQNSLADDEVLVDVKVTGLNFRDIMLTMGLVPDDALENGYSGPHLGLEFSGIVDSVGSKVSKFKKGDRVLGFGSSCFTNKLVVKEFSIAPIPNGWSYSSAATVPIVFFTAWYAISSLANMEKGESILIHGAAGGVGIAAIQIAKFLGLDVYATAGSDIKRDFLKLLGVDHIYNSRDLNFKNEILRDTEGFGVDAVLNCLSGEAMRESLSVLKPFGRFMELGKRDFVENTSVGLHYFKENISYFGIDVDQLFKFNPEKSKRIFSDVISLFDRGEFSSLPYVEFASSNVVNAFKYMQQGNQIGKVLVTYQDTDKLEVITNKDICSNTGFDNKSAIFDSNQIWLITGGTRGFGWATAKYLLNQGVDKVVLVSRSGLIDEKVISETLAYPKDKIVVKKCDVSDQDAVLHLWNELCSDCISVTGIINASAIFADKLLKDITLNDYQKVWNAKYLGAKNFHDVSGSHVKYFVVYSSISAAIGNIGQANYVSANAALEGLINQRISLGLHGSCIEWGPIDDTGYLQGNDSVKSSLELALGSSALKSFDALKLLPNIISVGGIQVVANINWLTVCEAMGKTSIPYRLNKVVEDNQKNYQSNSNVDFVSVIKAQSKAKAIKLISDLLISEIAETMGFTKDQVNQDQNLQSIGLDSLMAMDLIVSIEKLTGIKLSVMAFQDNPTVVKLAEKIYLKLNAGNVGREGSVENDESNSIEENDHKEVNEDLMLDQILKSHVKDDDLGDFNIKSGKVFKNSLEENQHD